MIGIDTNVLVRYIAQDDPEQSARATTFFETELTVAAPGFVSCVVLCELIWSLESAYRADRNAQADIVARLLSVNVIQLERHEAVARALQRFAASAGVDFADCLIAEIATEMACLEVATFDRTFARLSGVHLLG
jgi:predicted nucleic-acid-binding protein